MFSLRVLAFLFAGPAGAVGGPSQACSRSTEGPPFAWGRLGAATLSALSLVGWLVSTALLSAQSRTSTTTLLVRVGEQAQLQVQGRSAILRIRLASGVSAQLWGDEACATPIEKALVFSRSGTYTIPLDVVPSNNKAHVCLLSSDGILSDSVVWPETGTTTAETSAVSKP